LATGSWLVTRVVSLLEDIEQVVERLVVKRLKAAVVEDQHMNAARRLREPGVAAIPDSRTAAARIGRLEAIVDEHGGSRHQWARSEKHWSSRVCRRMSRMRFKICRRVLRGSFIEA
jgi:hypothetical protein